ncbi:DNA double-strand break repair nuclease NurA [Candidatus Bathyarchaeota archaeon]|nr:DNA double-strand break repair nuclease NurA [Candidatus Bathyarchaeota archaeon]
MNKETTKARPIKPPLPFRERYFSLFTGPEPETLHADLYQRLIDDGTDEIVKQLLTYNQSRKKLLSEVRDKIKVGKLKHDEEAANIRVVASDAGYNGVDLRSAYLPLYASVAVVAEGWTIPYEPHYKAGTPDVWSDEPEPQNREALLAAKIQYQVTEEAVEKWEPRLVVFDGTLAMHFLLLPSTHFSDDYQRDVDETIRCAVNLLQTCYRKNIPIVGFAKRTRMNQVCRSFGNSRMRDTALMDLILNLGEYTEPEAKPTMGYVIDNYREKAAEFGVPDPIIQKITNFYSSYVRTGLTTPYRLEIPEYCLNSLEEVGTVLYTTSEEETGIPFAINEVDRLTKITTSVSNIRTLMIYAKALELVEKGDMDLKDLTMLALQHGEPWTINDREASSAITGGK